MDLAKHWRQRASRYRLEGQQHRTSGEVRFPPEPTLGGTTELWQPYALSGVGTVFSFTVVRQPPAGYEQQSTYILALVKLAEGPLITAQLSDCDADHVTIDMQVEVITRRLRDLGPDGLIIYAYKFRPLLSQANA
jgi:uncharacterized OB-fold protein